MKFAHIIVSLDLLVLCQNFGQVGFDNTNYTIQPKLTPKARLDIENVRYVNEQVNLLFLPLAATKGNATLIM